MSMLKDINDSEGRNTSDCKFSKSYKNFNKELIYYPIAKWELTSTYQWVWIMKLRAIPHRSDMI